MCIHLSCHEGIWGVLGKSLCGPFVLCLYSECSAGPVSAARVWNLRQYVMTRVAVVRFDIHADYYKVRTPRYSKNLKQTGENVYNAWGCDKKAMHKSTILRLDTLNPPNFLAVSPELVKAEFKMIGYERKTNYSNNTAAPELQRVFVSLFANKIWWEAKSVTLHCIICLKKTVRK